jgi:hypothetical protein
MPCVFGSQPATTGRNRRLGEGYVRCCCNFAYVRRGHCNGEKGRQRNDHYANLGFVESSETELGPPYRKGDEGHFTCIKPVKR